MKRATSLPLRLATGLASLVLAAVLSRPEGAGSSALLGCQPCHAHVVAVDVSPTEPCITVTPSVCNLGGEGLRIDNACTDALSLTSQYFLEEGSIGAEGGTGLSSYVIQSDRFVNLLAGPNATGQNVLSLYGTLGGTPITITIGIVETSPDGALEDDGGDSGLLGVDAHASTRDAGKDAGKYASHDATSDASKDAGKDAGKDAHPDASSPSDAATDGTSEAPAGEAAASDATPE